MTWPAAKLLRQIVIFLAQNSLVLKTIASRVPLLENIEIIFSKLHVLVHSNALCGSLCHIQPNNTGLNLILGLQSFTRRDSAPKQCLDTALHFGQVNRTLVEVYLHYHLVTKIPSTMAIAI